jgi:hypothetical protein
LAGAAPEVSVASQCETLVHRVIATLGPVRLKAAETATATNIALAAIRNANIDLLLPLKSTTEQMLK